ncbi:MAG: hypothetical protein JWM07_373 [Candidatus Saccharibacteria bacterium]|nr:hypothetical protein [Candidatus Saccharibacteria bacterium]
MKSVSSQPKKSRKKIYIIGTVVGASLLAILSWWAYTAIVSYPLGEKLEYIGKKDTGCYINLVICDSNPSTTYYYATDLNQDQLVTYFHKASHLETQDSAVTSSSGYTYDYITFRAPDTNSIIDISYYNDANLIVRDMRLESTSKKHVISLDAKYYNTLQDSL